MTGSASAPDSTALPADWYAKGEPFMREKTALFAREWLPLCATEQLARPGDYATVTIGGWPILAIRSAQGVHALRNTCRHQNMMVLDKPVGNCEVLQCRYHGWRYELDGRFSSAPPLVAPADPAAADNHLVPLTSTQWNGLVLGCLDGSASAFGVDGGFAAALGGPAAKLMAAASTDLACNWKVLIEHRLAMTDWRFQWPLLLAQLGDSMTLLEIVVPRSFVRTRILSYVFGATADAAAAAALARSAADAAKTVCEALQPQYEAATPPISEAPRVHAFRARVRAAVGEA